MHPCEQIYRLGAENTIYGTLSGTCRITGKQSTGLNFDKWVRDTFTDHSYLKPGNIISNEALFCFDESSTLLQRRTGRDKPQRFRTYSHLIADGKWYMLTKADKPLIFDLICQGAELVCLADSGQKHILFKHRPGMWQLEEMQLLPDIELLKQLHKSMMALLALGFSQAEVISGNYLSYRILNTDLEAWQDLESGLKQYRKTKIFNFTSWMMYTQK